MDTTNTPVVSNKRWTYEAVGVVMMLMLGIHYSWSNFVTPMQEELGWSAATLALGYSICAGWHGVGSLFGGWLAKHIPRRAVLWLGMVILCAGFWVTSFTNAPITLYIGYGLLVATGAGMGYNALIGIVVPWFPDKKGFASGLLFMAFGLCTLIVAFFVTPMIDNFGWRGGFRIVGVLYPLLTSVLCLFLRPVTDKTVLPAAVESAKSALDFEPVELPAAKMIARPSFIAFFFWGAAMCGCGLLMIGHAATIAREIGFTATTAALLTGLLTGTNGVFRAIFGKINDAKGHQLVMATGSCMFIVGSLMMFAAIKTGNTIIMIAAFFLMGAAYGSITPTTTYVMGSFYGMKNYALNVGIANLNVLIASFGGPYVSGILHDLSGNYSSTALFVCAMGAIALILSRFVRKP